MPDIMQAAFAIHTHYPLYVYTILGAFAGLLRSALATGTLELPAIYRVSRKKDGARIIRLGCLTAAACGALAATMTDHWWVTSIGVAWAGPDALERAFNVKAARQRLKNGNGES